MLKIKSMHFRENFYDLLAFKINCQFKPNRLCDHGLMVMAPSVENMSSGGFRVLFPLPPQCLLPVITI